MKFLNEEVTFSYASAKAFMFKSMYTLNRPVHEKLLILGKN